MTRFCSSFWPLVLALGLSCAPGGEPEPDANDEVEHEPSSHTERDAQVRDARAPSSASRGDAGMRADPNPAAMRDAAMDEPALGARDASAGDAAREVDAAGTPRDAGLPLQPLPATIRDAGVVGLFPAPSAHDQCTDPPLRIEFDGPPTLGASGKIRLFDRSAPRTAAATLDLAVARIDGTRGGVTFAMERPAYVDGNAAVFYVPSGALRPGGSYFVQIEQGVVRGPGGRAFAIDDETSWTFSTKADVAGGPKLRVALDGTGDFCAVQAAVDDAPAGATIEIDRGTYHGIVYFRGKRDLTIRGADRKATILAGTNNENLNGGTAKRALIGVDASSGITFENLTIHNLTPQGGSQAEALRMQSCDRCSVRSADIISLQDTLLWSGRIYAEDCYIAGNVDFIWGTGTAFFERCEIKTLGRKGYNVQARNGAGGYGYVFVDSKLTSDPGITGNLLARVDSSVYPASHVAYIDCELGKHIDPVGWQVTGGGAGSLRFWEYRSKDPSGALVDVSRRLPGSRQISEEQAAMMRDPSVVLGGWSPE